MALDEAEKIENGTRDIKTRGRRFVDKWLRVMSAYAKEICFVLTVLFTVYAALHSGPLKTQKISSPNRFFPPDSMVTDYYLGSIYKAFEKISESDLTFVMYYATWDSQSMSTRWEFHKTANYFHDEIQFLAVNCWWPDGECRQHFRKIQSFPVLMVYPGIGRGIQYRGPHHSAFMFAFLEKIRNPIRRILNLTDLVNLRVICDTVIVAFFDFKVEKQPKGFNAYYNTAMKALERDPTRKVCFAVATERKMASLLGLTNTKDIILLHFNQTVIYDRQVVKDKVVSWTFKQRRPVAQWLNLPMSKSLMLSNLLEKSSPALVMFTPQNPINVNLYFNLLKEVAMEYYNCNDSSSVRDLIAHSIYLGSRFRSRFGQTDSECRDFNKKYFSDRKWDGKWCYSVAVQLISNSSSRCDVCSVRDRPSDVRRTLKLLPGLSRWSNCVDFRSNYDPASQVTVCCRDSIGDDDPTIEVAKDFMDFECKKQMVADSYGDVDFPYLDKSVGRSISGLGCRTNRSLSFAAVDSNRFRALANSVGVHLDSFEHRSAVLIHHTQFKKMCDRVDREQSLCNNYVEEKQFLMKGRISRNSLKEFIWNFTDNHLERHLKTDTVKIDKNGPCDDSKNVCVVEVASNNFVESVLTSEKDVVLLYYTHWCGFCLGIFHTFLQAAFYFKNVPDLIFARINGDSNDLPWEFTVENYPTVLFFPAGRKIESQAFPDNLQITLSNLISFVLANAGLSNRLYLAIKSCSTNNCINRNKRLISSHIQTILADIRELMARLNQVERTNSMKEFKKFLFNQLETKQKELRHCKRLNLLVNRINYGFNSRDLNDIVNYVK